MTYQITPNDIDQLKNVIETTDGDSYAIANQVQLLLDNHARECLQPSYQGEQLYDAPLKTGEGLVLECTNNWETPIISIEQDLLNGLEKLFETVENITLRMERLEGMHNGVIDHIPEIISTREQYEEMKPEMDKEDRVLVHTTFDKALSVL